MSEQSRAAFRSVSTKSIVTLSVLGVAMVVLYRIAIHSKSVADIGWFLKLVVVQIVIYLAVAWLSLRGRDSRPLLVLGLIFAALFRLSIIFSPPYLSDDIYRYIWDGRVQAAGINPYRYIPADESLADLRDEKIYPNINRRDYAHTMYPPIAEGAFLLITRFSESVTWMKAAMVGFEAVAVWALVQLLISFGFARQRVLIYAWHPLTVWEFAGSGHLDAMAIAFIALALLARRKQRETLTGFLLACATCVKFFPAVLFPAVCMRKSWKMPLAFAAMILVAYLPYLKVGPVATLGFLPGYASERGMISGEQFFLLTVARQLLSAHVPTSAYLVFAVAALGVLSVWLIRDQPSDDIRYLRNGLSIASVFMVLLSPNFSWYFSWLIPFLGFTPSIPVFYLTLASFLLYLTWLNDTPNRVLMLKTFIFAPFLILSVIVIFRRWKSTALPRESEIAPLIHTGLQVGEPKSFISVIIAALNEEAAIANVINSVPKNLADEIVVVDNGSKDRTGEIATAAGARVVKEPVPGYGRAFRAGLRSVSPKCEIVVFLDGDGSDCPEMMDRLVTPIMEGKSDFVIGSRTRGKRETGSMNFHQVLAGYMVGFFLRILYGVRSTDMGPFRAIRRDTLDRLRLREETYGWPLEMQMRAAHARVRTMEVPVDYRRRAGGHSKIAGTVRGSVLAATRILITLARVAIQRN